MQIRKMRISDYAAVKQLWLDCDLTEEPEDDLSAVAALLNCPQAAGFVAEEKDRITGAVLCGTDGRYGYIHHLAVQKENRRSGAGRNLVAACTTFLQCRHILVMVRKENKQADIFWSHLTFSQANGLHIRYRSCRQDVQLSIGTHPVDI